jgi:hypothetical protein
MSLFANLLMLLGSITWLIGESIGIHNHTASPDTTSEWLRILRRKLGRLAFAGIFVALSTLLLIHTETSWP